MKLEELRDLLDKVRSQWPEKWPGMQNYVDQCLGILGHSAALESNQGITAIYRCMTALAEQIESHGRQLAERGEEPPYHNRLHTVDTLFSLTALLLGQRHSWTKKTAAWRRRCWACRSSWCAPRPRRCACSKGRSGPRLGPVFPAWRRSPRSRPETSRECGSAWHPVRVGFRSLCDVVPPQWKRCCRSETFR